MVIFKIVLKILSVNLKEVTTQTEHWSLFSQTRQVKQRLKRLLNATFSHLRLMVILDVATVIA